jgi:hypothetical protein
MARAAGLETIARPGHELYLCRVRADREPPSELAALRSALAG